MSATPAAALLRPGLLEGRALMLAHAAGSETSEAVRATCEGLGASVSGWPHLGAEGLDDEVEVEVERLLAEEGAPDVLVVDLAGAFAAPAGTSAERLVRCIDSAWSVTRAVAAGAFLPGADATPRGGRVIYVAPATATTSGARADSGEHADAVRAAVENLARTLSIEWARFAVTTVAIATGPASAAEDLAALIAYLASDAGAYFSGCQLDLRGV